MASFKEKLDKNGNRIYEVQASNGRGRRVWRTFRPEPTWSKRTIQRELQKFAAELEQQLADGEFSICGFRLQKFLTGDVYFLQSNPDTTITEPGNTPDPMTVASYNGADRVLPSTREEGILEVEDSSRNSRRPE